MGKMKEVFLQHQQEHEDDFARYYAEMYKTAEYMGAEKVFDTLYKATIEIKPSNKPKKRKMSGKENTKTEEVKKETRVETRKDTLRRLFIENNLVQEDVFKHQHYTIITRAGIDKIQAAQNIQIRYELSHLSEDHDYCLIKAFGKLGDKIIETFGEATPKNNKNAYTVAMAEKRAMSRIVLKLAGFYELGIFGEDESDDFKKR